MPHITVILLNVSKSLNLLSFLCFNLQSQGNIFLHVTRILRVFLVLKEHINLIQTFDDSETVVSQMACPTLLPGHLRNGDTRMSGVMRNDHPCMV